MAETVLRFMPFILEMKQTGVLYFRSVYQSKDEVTLLAIMGQVCNSQKREAIIPDSKERVVLDKSCSDE